ncbi:hypothetical protein HID58_037774 [Brassica napus]|uniref:Uncharacterized protein n=1 Tax=Brassica napus TaxID=3708 RepID=A0ABQ8BN70_BRANA|nr:hypothetical protein HID58_037774 [Brassica napus]
MVSPSSVTPSRRVTRSQYASDRKAIPKKIPREGKSRTRYEVMTTESEVDEPASTDQEEAASTEQDEAASTEPEFIVTTPTFPERLFARNCYPAKPRLNIYSKASIIGSLVKLLRGSPEMNCLLGSQFRALFHLHVIVTYSIPDEGGDPKWKKEIIDPRIDNLVRRMREGHEFKATDFRGGDSSLPPLKAAEKAEGVGVKKKCQKPFRRFGKACDEPGSSTQAPERPIRPRRGICKQAEPGNLSDKEQELKEWIRVELKTQLGKLRNEIFDWLHHDRGGSSTVPQNTAAGKTNRDNGHADPNGMEVPKKRRPFSGDGNDEAEIFGSDSKKHKKNNGDGFSDEETIRMHDNHCDCRTPNARFWKKVDSMAGEGPSFSKSAKIPEADVSKPIGPETVSKPTKPTLPEPLEVFSVDYQLFVLACEVYRNTDLFGQVNLRGILLKSSVEFGEGGDGSPISGLNLLAEEVEKGTRSDNVYKDPQENTCRMLTVWSHPESYVLPPEEQGGKASPTNSEDYKTPPEDDPMTESRTPDVGNSKLSRYLTRSLKKAELGGKCIPISSTKKDDIPTKRIPRRSTKIGGVYTPDRRLKKLFQSCRKPKYTPLADLEIAQFQEFQSILRENPAQEFEIVIGIHVSNKFFLSLARPTNWVSTEATWTQLPEWEVQICRLLQYCGHHIKVCRVREGLR